MTYSGVLSHCNLCYILLSPDNSQKVLDAWDGGLKQKKKSLSNKNIFFILVFMPLSERDRS